MQKARIVNLQKCQTKIAELVARFVTEIKGETAMSRTDPNRVAESVLVPLFRIVYGYQRLRNLNHTDRVNFPGIDLADDTAGVAFQVTATSTSSKIKETLRTFSEAKFYERYSHLIVYILTERQQSYSGRGFEKYIDGRFTFDKTEDIRDYRHLLRAVERLPLEEALNVLSILEQHIGEKKPVVGRKTPLIATEPLFLNFVEIEFPSTLYLADLTNPLPRDDGGRRQGVRRFRRRLSERDQVKAVLKEEGLNFSSDWTCHAQQIVTFHDLGNSEMPISRIVDQGTISSFAPEDYYRISDDHERIFKGLLRYCLQQKIFKKGIQWQNRENLFIFVEAEDGGGVREEHWEGPDSRSRKVYERKMKNNKPDEILSCKHLAFATEFRRYGSRWFLLIKPEWFFSFDGYHRNRFASKSVDWLKRHEWNTHVFNHFKFIIRHIDYEAPSDLYYQSRPRYPFVKFKELLTISGSPAIDDKDWLATEELSHRKKSEDEGGTLPLPF